MTTPYGSCYCIWYCMNFLKKNWFQMMVWIVGLVFAGFNMFQSSQINSALMLNRLMEIEKVQAADGLLKDNLLPRFYVLEQKELTSTQDVKDIKDSVVRLEGKIDQILQNQNTSGGTK